jgi:ribosomal protein RSM22 (predicted rRNA methylase)
MRHYAAGTEKEKQQQALRGVVGADEAETKTPGQRRVDDTVMALWARVAPGGAMVLIEPGTPRASELVRGARSLILAAEAEKTAVRRCRLTR